MSRTLFIGALTALSLPPPRLVEAAARAGVAGCGLRLRPAAPGGIAYPLMDDAAQMRETRAALAATGMQVFDIEMVRIGPAFDVGAHRGFFDAAAALGARHVLVAGDDPDEARTAAAFARVCEALAPLRMTADLEFMPWTEVRDLAAAARIVAAAAQPNGGILVDALHFARCGATLAALDAVPRERFHYMQICDGPAEAPATRDGLIHAARCERLLPGEGGIDLAGLLGRLPAHLPVCIETPSESRAPVLGWDEWLRRAVAATRAVLAGLPAA
ncbi:MAG: sugar phosphate isomerase/epimerase [Burkholderiales bacterium]|nr:sugar phosphate isomerase/epimerase [Burkholderiales bacterium]